MTDQPEQACPIESVPTEVLYDEIARRHKSTLICVEQFDDGANDDSEGMIGTFQWGGRLSALGLAHYAVRVFEPHPIMADDDD